MRISYPYSFSARSTLSIYVFEGKLANNCRLKFDHVVNFVEEGNSLSLGASHVPRHCLGWGAQYIPHCLELIDEILNRKGKRCGDSGLNR